MQLRPKLTVILVAAIAVSVVSNYAIQRIAVEPSFRALEHSDAIEDWERCRNAILRDEEALSLQCFDFASWDDTFNYIQDKNPGYYDVNLKSQEWFTNQKVDLMVFCRPDGSVYWSHIATLDSGEETKLAWLPTDKVPLDHPLMAVTGTKESEVTGAVLTELGFMMVASRPILTSKNEGPMAGVLIFGRRITDETVAKLRKQTGVQFEIKDPASKELTAQERTGMAAALQADAPAEELLDANHLAVRGVIRGLKNEPMMLVETTGERGISKQGRGALAFATWSVIASGVLTLGLLVLALRWMITRPLGALTRYATHVGESGYKLGTVDLKRSDEIGTLARAFDKMLVQLDEFRAKSVAASRQAGMAEVATGVLHNVGNAMTNVNVLADTVAGKLAKSKVPSLAKVSELLNEHRGDLPGFFREGAQGQQLPAYITQLASHLGNEMTDVQQDLAGLREGLQHIKQIVASHQNIAKCSNFFEPADPADVVAKTLVLVEASLRKHGVAAVLEGHSPVPVACDRSKLSQVLLNLLTNAKESLLSAGVAEPRITVRIGRAGTDAVFIEVSDNGPGISPEHREKLFSKGFTTKDEGRGVGLHYCWLAIREMNGTLGLAAGCGSGGATFRIELPTAVGAGRLAA